MFSRFLRSSLKLACWATLAGCAQQALDAGEPTGTATQAVIGGELSPAEQDGVVLLRTDRDTAVSVCSGSLLAPNLVMTARHCITARYPEDDIHCNSDGTLDLPSGGQLGAPARPADVHVFTGTRVSTTDVFPDGVPAANGTTIVTTDGPSVCRDDLALVVLDRALDLPLVPLDVAKPIKVGDRVTTVGYGLTELSSATERYSARHQRTDLKVQYVGTLPNTFVLSRSVCKGDSGGPALDSATGAVLGVYSLGFPGDPPAGCNSDTSLNYFVRVGRYEALLRQAFEAAEQPFPEPPSETGGADAGAGGESPVTAGTGAGGSR